MPYSSYKYKTCTIFHNKPRATITNVTQVTTITNAPQRNIIFCGGYYFIFYIRALDNYLVYRSSSNKVTWGPETIASHNGLSIIPVSAGGDYTIFTDGTSILITYPIGTYSLVSDNATTIYTRIGAQSGGVINWSLPVAIRNDGGYWRVGLAKTQNRFYLATVSFTPSLWTYHVDVYISADATAWANILYSTTMTEPTNRCGMGLCKWPQYTDGIIIVTGLWNDTAYSYKTFDGWVWGADNLNSLGVKTPFGYIENDAFSLAATDTEVEFLHIPSQIPPGGIMRHQYFTTAWSAPVIVDASNCININLSKSSSQLYAIYTIGNNFYYRRMDYSTHIWDATAKFLTSDTSPSRMTSEQYPQTSMIGIVWVNNPVSPFNLKTRIFSG